MLHVIPVPDDAVLHGVVDLQHGAQLAGLVAHHQVLGRRSRTVQRGDRGRPPWLGPPRLASSTLAEEKPFHIHMDQEAGRDVAI